MPARPRWVVERPGGLAKRGRGSVGKVGVGRFDLARGGGHAPAQEHRHEQEDLRAHAQEVAGRPLKLTTGSGGDRYAPAPSHLCLGLTHEGKATDADHIAKLATMPKGQVNTALQELVAAKRIRRIEHHKAARYVVQPVPTAPAV